MSPHALSQQLPTNSGKLPKSSTGWSICGLTGMTQVLCCWCLVQHININFVNQLKFFDVISTILAIESIGSNINLA